MKYDLSAITNSAATNAGGLCSFLFVPKESLELDVEYRINGNTILDELVLIGGADWLKASCMQDTMGFSEVQEDTPAGQKYVQTIVGVINSDSQAMTSLMNALPHHEYVVIYTDRQGIRKLIGNRQRGMSFQAVFATGSEFVGKRSYTLTLVHESAERAALYPF